MKKVLFIISLLFLQIAWAQHKGESQIWFNHAAAHWNEALPVGNGRLGAMVFGGVHTERLQLNEETVWTGKKEDFVNPGARAALPEVRRLLFAGEYAAAQKLAQEKLMGDKKVYSTYQTLGDLQLEFKHPKGDVSDYKRTLDLETATATVKYRIGNTTYTREVLASAPGKALVVRLSANKKGALNFNASLSRPGNKAAIKVASDEISMSEHVGGGVGVNMVARLKLLPEGGKLSITKQSLTIDSADAVTLILTAATDYRGTDPAIVSAEDLDQASARPYEVLRSEHIKEYQNFFKRVTLNLGTTDAVHFPTDTRITALQNGNRDPHLIKLYFDFGRYLLISSSRPGSLPANLQGIWADGLTPPWSADYHININIQMNYWPAEITNLSEMHLPFLQFLKELLPDARKTAKDMYGLDGTVAHFTTDPWHFTEPYGQTQWAMWPMGMAWSVQHFWEHYLFTEDKAFLAQQAYPVMKEAAQFCKAWLVENPVTKQLVSGPSISPENTFKTKQGEVATMVMGPTMDHMIIHDVFTNTIEAAQVLRIDAAFRKKLEQALRRLAPVQIGRDGRIMEWTEEFEEPEPGHRHISHLFGLHPGRQITAQKAPQLLAAARKTIDYRLAHGGGHTGWSRAWIINFFARLQDGDKAHENIIQLLQKSTLPNLFDNHPPFQIDGNFGATAGIAEMLLQSHAGEIHLLPALPRAWPDGHIYGIVARGGFEVAMDWEGSKLKTVKILSKLGNACTIRYGDKVINLKTEKGKTYTFNAHLQPI